MTTGASVAREIRCVSCLTKFRWAGGSLFQRSSRIFKEIDIPEGADEMQRRMSMQGAFIRCPNIINGQPHHFPVEFVRYQDPIVIGFIGGSQTGKSCLLAAITGEIELGRLAPYGLLSRPANMDEHSAYRELIVDPFYDKRQSPGHTAVASDLAQYADAFLITSTRTNETFPLVFFDVNGDSLRGLRDNLQAVRFLSVVNGLIFVVDPDLAGGGSRLRLGDPTYTATVASLRVVHDVPVARMKIPAALAVTKADMVRFAPPVDRWLNLPPPSDGVIDAGRVYAESRDAYAFLKHREASPWLDPVNQFERCTLHFVSASGVGYDADKSIFARPVRPRRVLDPLVSLLAMIGVIDDKVVGERIGF